MMIRHAGKRRRAQHVESVGTLLANGDEWGCLLLLLAETVWVGKSICSTCKRASAHEEIAACRGRWMRGTDLLPQGPNG
jgi:hypothetical protein